MSTKIITCIYANLHGTELGGRPSRGWHYRWSLMSLLRMSKADFLCYTSEDEYDDLCNFFYKENGVNSNKLEIKIFDINQHDCVRLFQKYKDYDFAKVHDRCMEIQYMKYYWFLREDLSYDYYYWFDAGLSHSGLIPNKYLINDVHDGSQYYRSTIFDNRFLDNLIEMTGDKFFIVAKENQRNYWSGTVDPIHFNQHNMSHHIIGGFFGGKKHLWVKMMMLYTKYIHQVAEHDKRLYHEEDYMTLMFRNHPELYTNVEFDTWWHEDMSIAGCDMEEHVKINKSFYKILEEIRDYKEGETQNFLDNKSEILQNFTLIESEILKLDNQLTELKNDFLIKVIELKNKIN